jgi:penicillin-binding protein 1C
MPWQAKPLRWAWWLCGAGLALFAALTYNLAQLHSPEASWLAYDRHGVFLGQLNAQPEGYGYWPLAMLPPRIAAATLALEDRRFWRHPGFDLYALGRATWQNLSSGRRISGGSTVAMQLARLQQPAPRTLWVKLRETGVAFWLTQRYGREAVLRQYLRLAPYGNRVHGIAAAARFYFDKPADDLSWAEIALLTAIPQAPTKMNLLHPAGLTRARQRGARILTHLRDQDMLSPAEYTLAQQQLAVMPPPVRKIRPTATLHAILALEQALRNHPPAQPLLRTTLDLAMTQQAAQVVSAQLLEWRSRGAENAALLVVEPQSGAMRVYLGAADYFDRQHHGAVDFARLRRPAGSTLKPFFYALALEQGLLHPDSLLADLPYHTPGQFQNADLDYLGWLRPRQALANSRNLPAVQVLAKLGLERGYAWLGELGVHPKQEPAARYGLTLALGSLPVRLSDLTGGYTVLADAGKFHPLHWLDTTPPVTPQSGLSADTAALVSLFLADPQARLPSFPRMGPTEYPFPVAVKTGTSQGYRDAWTVAYSRRFLVSAWVGRTDARPMDRLGGAEGAGTLVQTLLLALHASGQGQLSDLAFPLPRRYQPSLLCLDPTQSNPRADCAHAQTEWLLPAAPSAALLSQQVADRPAQLSILSPRTGVRLLRNPQLPSQFNTIALKAESSVPGQILWLVDGKPFQTADLETGVRWPLSPGEHRIQAQLALRPERSASITIWVE